MNAHRPAHSNPSPADPPRRELAGVVERITYHNPETGYAVARLLPERGDEVSGREDDRLVTVVGSLPNIQPGEAITASGWWRNDPRHGWQSHATDYRTTLPATVQGMRRYLGSGLVKGIGPVMAGRLVDTFGEATFAVIDEQPERLTEVPGIGPVRAARIAATWDEQRHIREVMTALQGYGVSTSLAVRIYQRFRNDSARVIAEEPYRLAREAWGIGFTTADQIARAVGIGPDAPSRQEAGVLHAMDQLADDGHTLLPEADVATQTADVLGTAPDGVDNAIAALLDAGELVAAGRDGTDERRVALAPFARAESGLASRLQAVHAAGTRSRVGAAFGEVDWTAAFGWLADAHGLRLAPEQEAGVRMMLTAPVSILTGGPGTGKTHTLRAVLLLARAKGLRCTLAAPTGRAAKRMTEATGQPAGTLHRVLGLRPGGRPAHGPDDPLPADLVVVDEVSMLDVLLANQLVKAVAPGTHLLLVGDPDQLPSVGAGDVLADLLRSGRFPVTRLTEIFRQGAGSGIAANARRINTGQLPAFGGAISDCYFLAAETPEETARLVVEFVADDFSFQTVPLNTHDTVSEVRDSYRRVFSLDWATSELSFIRLILMHEEPPAQTGDSPSERGATSSIDELLLLDGGLYLLCPRDLVLTARDHDGSP